MIVDVKHFERSIEIFYNKLAHINYKFLVTKQMVKLFVF